MKKPFLIQRCVVDPESLRYLYMGSAEFEFGACPESLKRLFATGLCNFSTALTVEGKEVSVYLVAGDHFSVSDYQQYLEQLARNELRLKEESEFDDALKHQVGVSLGWEIQTNVWFDIENDILWTLDEKDRELLVQRLNEIKEAWKK